MLFIGLVGNVGDGIPSTEGLDPAHLGGMVSLERSEIDLSQPGAAECANAQAENKVWYEPLWICVVSV